jgi:hypothetical protein
VIVEPDPGADVALPGAVQGELDAHVGFRGGAADFGGASLHRAPPGRGQRADELVVDRGVTRQRDAERAADEGILEAAYDEAVLRE